MQVYIDEQGRRCTEFGEPPTDQPPAFPALERLLDNESGISDPECVKQARAELATARKMGELLERLWHEFHNLNSDYASEPCADVVDSQECTHPVCAVVREVLK